MIAIQIRMEPAAADQLDAARAANEYQPSRAAYVLSAVLEKLGRESAAVSGRCRVCGCTDNAACEGGCWWIEERGSLYPPRTLCSQCEGGKGEKGGKGKNESVPSASSVDESAEDAVKGVCPSAPVRAGRRAGGASRRPARAR